AVRGPASDSGLVFPGARVDAQDVALLDEEGDLDDVARFQSGRLPRAGLGVACVARLGLGHRQLDGDGQLDPDRLAFVGHPFEGHAFLEEVERLIELRCAQRELLEGFGVHEMDLGAVTVEVLDGPLVEPRAGPPLASLEGPLDGLALLHVAQLDAHLGRPAAHLDVVEVEDLPELPIELDSRPLFQVSGRDHEPSLATPTSRVSPSGPMTAVAGCALTITSDASAHDRRSATINHSVRAMA